MDLIALVPELVATAAPGVVIYGETEEISVEVVESCGFFVPHYMGPKPNLSLSQRMPRLEVCQLLTAGFDVADLIVPPEVTMCNAPGVHDASTSELAVGMVLASLRGIDDAARDMDAGLWNNRAHLSLADRRVLIIGSGGVGRAIHDRLLPFEVEIRMVARSARDGIAGIDQLPTLLPQCDIVIVAIPLDESTRGMVNAEFLRLMTDGALLVNVSRGAVADTSAIIAETGRLKFALDVTDPEPLPSEHPLWRCSNVLITPHLGGRTSGFVPRARRLVREQVARWFAGEPLQGVIR